MVQTSTSVNAARRNVTPVRWAHRKCDMLKEVSVTTIEQSDKLINPSLHRVWDFCTFPTCWHSSWSALTLTTPLCIASSWMTAWLSQRSLTWVHSWMWRTRWERKQLEVLFYWWSFKLKNQLEQEFLGRGYQSLLLTNSTDIIHSILLSFLIFCICLLPEVASNRELHWQWSWEWRQLPQWPDEQWFFHRWLCGWRHLFGQHWQHREGAEAKGDLVVYR